MKIFAEYDWPGNVRELENFIERVAIMTESTLIETNMLPDYFFNSYGAKYRFPSSDNSGSRLESMERESLLESLSRNGWIQQNAARDLGLTLRQIGYRVKKYNLGKIIAENKKKRTSSLDTCRQTL